MSTADEADARGTSTGRRWKAGIQAVVGIGIAVALIAFALPKVTGTSWHDTAQAFERVTWWQAVGMFGLLLSAMWSYTFVLTGSLPGLTHVRALMLNLA
ncbi:MAG: hypothetical protein ACTHNT_14270, partial [Actinomycetales bacterium]